MHSQHAPTTVLSFMFEHRCYVTREPFHKTIQPAFVSSCKVFLCQRQFAIYLFKGSRLRKQSSSTWPNDSPPGIYHPQFHMMGFATKPTTFPQFYHRSSPCCQQMLDPCLSLTWLPHHLLQHFFHMATIWLLLLDRDQFCIAVIVVRRHCACICVWVLEQIVTRWRHHAVLSVSSSPVSLTRLSPTGQNSHIYASPVKLVHPMSLRAWLQLLWSCNIYFCIHQSLHFYS